MHICDKIHLNFLEKNTIKKQQRKCNKVKRKKKFKQRTIDQRKYSLGCGQCEPSHTASIMQKCTINLYSFFQEYCTDFQRKNQRVGEKHLCESATQTSSLVHTPSSDLAYSQALFPTGNPGPTLGCNPAFISDTCFVGEQVCLRARLWVFTRIFMLSLYLSLLKGHC